MHTDVGNSATRADELGRQFERGGHANRLDRDVGTQAAGHGQNGCECILTSVVDDDVGAELLGGLEPGIGHVDGDDVARAEEAGAHDRGEADRTGTDDGDDVARLDAAVEHTHFVPCRQDVGEHQQLLVRHPIGSRVRRRVGERYADEFGLRAVDLVTEYPTAAADALAVATLPAEPARAACGDTRDEDLVARLDVLDGCSDFLDGSDRLMAQDAPVGHGWHVALEDVQIRSADRDGVDADDRIGVGLERWLGHFLPSLLTWAVVHESLHGNTSIVGHLIQPGQRRLERGTRARSHLNDKSNRVAPNMLTMLAATKLEL